MKFIVLLLLFNLEITVQASDTAAIREQRREGIVIAFLL